MPKILQLPKAVRESVVVAPFGLFFRVIPVTESIIDIVTTFKPFTVVKELHVTTIFSKEHFESNVPDVGKGVDLILGRMIGLEWWPGHDQTGWLVSHIGSPQIVSINTDLVAHGIVPTFLDYKPHMTLMNPIAESSAAKLIAIFNQRLTNDPLELEFYDAGYKANVEDL